jgi:hypothetical protein
MISNIIQMYKKKIYYDLAILKKAKERSFGKKN